jgi:hypothetical protein
LRECPVVKGGHTGKKRRRQGSVGAVDHPRLLAVTSYVLNGLAGDLFVEFMMLIR